jgi:hypothetical protein
MEALSFAHVAVMLLVCLVFGVAYVFPILGILRRAGHSGWWSLLSFVELFSWVGLWAFAHARWPALRRIEQ